MVFKHPSFHETAPEIEVEFPARAALESAVSDALASSGGIDASDISVMQSGSSIVLTGTVLREEEAVRAEEIAINVHGVQHVRNELAVTGLDQVPRAI